MAKKTVRFSKTDVDGLPDDSPVVYKILTEGGRNNYTGVAQRGRVRARVSEHLPGRRDAVPGASVEIEQTSSIKQAREKEARILRRSHPRYNIRGV
jgi:hypothetical protein